MSRLKHLIEITDNLAARLNELEFGGEVAYVLNPLVYARSAHVVYLERFAKSAPETILLGMNPGPFGMVQTGIPFGDVVMVRDWLGITSHVKRPATEHPKRPVMGFDCQRREVSGTRLWTWAKERFGTPERFFSRFFVANYCPLAFFETSGKNRTPDKLPAKERRGIYDLCDEALKKTVDILNPRFCIGIGAFAEQRILAAGVSDDVVVGRVLHPSPASPLANKGWAEQVDRQLEALGAL